MHSDAPTAPLYEPASQAVQATPSATPVYPRLHLQSVRLLLPAGDEECVGHAKHKSGSCAPITSEYDATGQGVQRIAASVAKSVGDKMDRVVKAQDEATRELIAIDKRLIHISAKLNKQDKWL